METLTPRDIAIYVALISCAFGGWNLYFHGKMRDIANCWKKLDTLEGELRALELRVVEKFATKRELKESFDKLDGHLTELRRSIDRLVRRVPIKRVDPDSDPDA